MSTAFNTIILEYLPYYDVAAMFILFLLIISIFLRRLNKAKSSKIFLVLLVITALSGLFDIGSMLIIKHYVKRDIRLIDDNFFFSNTWITLFFLFRYSIVFSYSIYILSLTNSLKNIVSSKLYVSLLTVPYFLMLIILFTNPFTQIYYALSWGSGGELIFGSGKFFLALPIIESYYLIFIAIHLFKNRSLFSKIKYYTLFLMIPTTIISFIVRLIDNETIIEVLLFSLAFLIIVQNVESPELLIDSKTGLSSSKQFNFIIEKDYLYKANAYLVFINFINYSDIYRKMNYDSANRYVKLIARELELIVNGNIIYALDEGLFAVKYTNRDDALKYADKVFKELTNVRFIDLSFVPELSISIVNIKDDFETANKLIEYVDNFHDENRIGVFEFSSLKNDINEVIKINIDTILENAFKFNNFKVYYQPIYDINKKKFTTAEALCRIEDNKYGLLIPDQFIPFAEARGVIGNIDLFVIEKVMSLLNKIDIKEYGLEAISINLSLIDFNNKDFISKIISLKEKYKINPSYIKFEIAENKNMSYSSDLYSIIEELGEYGFEFILDDYGTGYSNLERFAKLPIKYVKVDRGLVKLSNQNQINDALRTTFNMIHELDRISVVEGIESEDDLNKFKEYNCAYAQGSYLSNVLPENEFLDFIKDKVDNPLVV